MPPRKPATTTARDAELKLSIDNLAGEVSGVRGELQRVSDAAAPKWLVGLAICATVGALIALGVVANRVVDDRAARDDRAIATCRQQNRAFADFLVGMTTASGFNPADPAIARVLERIPRRDCSPEGIRAYFDHSPKDQRCDHDGTGFCVVPTTTTTMPAA